MLAQTAARAVPLRQRRATYQTLFPLTFSHVIRKHSSSPCRAFDAKVIRAAKPFDQWLASEMRSNHAGETGAVCIYGGSLWALSVRRMVRSSGGLLGRTLVGECPRYEEALWKFAEEHRESEAKHVKLLNEVMDEEDKSRLLPAWRAAGFALGAVSTLWCPRGMYLTTEAVEAFVEEHYGGQIRRLREETVSNSSLTSSGVSPLDAIDEVGEGMQPNVAGKKELIAMLEYCCADEIHHKEEARERADEGPLPWFEQVDIAWQALVGSGSAAAAGFAKRI